MQSFADRDSGEPRWEYRILWRYGALLLVVVGLAAMAVAVAGVSGTAISLALLPIGFVSLVAGVVLPRIEGKFTAGPSGLSAEMMAVHVLDQRRFVVSGPALAVDEPRAQLEPGAGADDAANRIKLGDVWDALDLAGLRPEGVGMGSAYFNMPDGRLLRIPNRGFFDHGIASSELLALFASWRIEPIASGQYPMPAGATGYERDPIQPMLVPDPKGHAGDGS